MKVSENISDHPELQDVKRKAFFARLHVDHKVNSIALHLVIKHYSSKMEPMRTLHDIDVKLVADNTTRVDSNGSIIPRVVDNKPNPTWQSGLGEFDFIEQMMISEGTLGNALYPIVKQYIKLSDARNRFDASIYK